MGPQIYVSFERWYSEQKQWKYISLEPSNPGFKPATFQLHALPTELPGLPQPQELVLEIYILVEFLLDKQIHFREF